MEQYINKSALVAEIKRIIDILINNSGYIGAFGENQITIYEDILSLINTFEVKEINLEKELNEYGLYYDYTSLDRKEMIDLAKHFFELGLKIQHDWKVVDNTNLPQADRNKIYCVFTKQRYILAKVIDHPQNEDLLQWKCTEFPHHRYDMCEGDKYMVIN